MRVGRLLLFLALVAAILVAAAGFGHRFGLWGTAQAFDMLRIGAWASAGVVALSVLGLLWLVSRRRFVAVVPAIAALIVAGVALYAPWKLAEQAQATPPLHDVATDPLDPPPFVALAPARAAAPNGARWSGNAELQRQHYPDLAPLVLPLPAEQAMARVRAAAEALGWTVVASDAKEGRLEASDRTLWFGFVDDIVARLRPQDGGTRIDVRSASREGLGDLGKNAQRIDLLFGRLTDEPG